MSDAGWFMLGVGVTAWLAVLVDEFRATRRRLPKPAPRVTVTGLDDLVPTEGAVRWATIQGVRFLSIDDLTADLTEYADRIERIGQTDRARQVRHVRDHFAVASLELDLEDPS